MSEQSGCREPHILLVEDNPGDVLLIKESIREIGRPLRLSVAKDGQEALDFLQKIGRNGAGPAPDLILLDLNLPKVSGHEVLAYVKGNAEIQNIPVLVLSTSRSPADIRQAYALAANCYLCKPPSLEELFHLMRTLQEFWLGMVWLAPTDGPGPRAHSSGVTC